MEPIAVRLQRLPQIGRLEWIGVSSSTRAPIQSLTEAELIVGHGLAVDHHAKHRAGGKRQVTLIQAEHLAAITGFLQRTTPVQPNELRRNLVVSGINLLALKGRRFRVGGCLLEYTGPCDPCSRMDENLGPGGLNAMRGHGGITARVLTGGAVRLGDPVQALTEPPAESGNDESS